MTPKLCYNGPPARSAPEPSAAVLYRWIQAEKSLARSSGRVFKRFFFFFYNTWILLSFRQDLTRLYDMKKKIVKPRRTMSYYHVICHHGESKLKIFNAFAKKKKKISFKRNVHVTPRASDAFFHEYAFMNPIDLMRTTRRKH